MEEKAEADQRRSRPRRMDGAGDRVCEGMDLDWRTIRRRDFLLEIPRRTWEPSSCILSVLDPLYRKIFRRRKHRKAPDQDRNTGRDPSLSASPKGIFPLGIGRLWLCNWALFGTTVVVDCMMAVAESMTAVVESMTAVVAVIRSALEVEEAV